MSTAIAPACQNLPAVRSFERFIKSLPQVFGEVEDFLHAGCYVRSLRMPAGVVLVGALMKAPVVLVVSGHCLLTVGNRVEEVDGFKVMAGEAGRKTIFRSLSEVVITTVNATQAEDTAAAVRELTDDEIMGERE